MNPTFESQIAPYAEQLRALPAPAGDTTTLTPPTPTPLQKRILRHASKAIKAWENSEEGQAQMDAMRQMSVDELKQALTDFLNGSVMASTIAMITLPDNLPNLGFQSITIGVDFEAEILIGLTGSSGISVGIEGLMSGNPVEQVAYYLSLGYDAGVEGGAMGGVQFGIWQCMPEDFGGKWKGAEVMIDDDIGIAVGAHKNSSSGDWGFTIDFDAGIDDGVATQTVHTFLLFKGQLGFPPIYQPEADHFLILTKLYCENISGGDGDHNEVFFDFQVDGGTTYPYPTWDYFAMAEGDTWYCGRSVRFDSSIYISLYDSDDTSGNDLLGQVNIPYSDLVLNEEISFSIYSKHDFDVRQYYIYAKLIY